MPTLSNKQNSKSKNHSVQTILFNKKYYHKQQIPKILKALGYNKNEIHETSRFFRVRQFNPGFYHEDPRYIIKNSIIPGIQYVIEY